MRTIVLLLLSYASVAQQPADVYSQYTRLGMNGPVKTVTTYKYTRLKYTKGKEEQTTGTLYSVIKNWYDTAGHIIQDSTALYYNPKAADGYCKTYRYDTVDNTPVIHIITRFDCLPAHDNKPPERSIIELTAPNDSTILAREYAGATLPRNRSRIVSSYRFFVRNGLIRKTIFDAYQKRHRFYGDAIYQYDKYNNFTQTTLTIGETPKQVTKHKILTIDDHGNALRMLNFINNAPQPDFMTKYEYEYYP